MRARWCWSPAQDRLRFGTHGEAVLDRTGEMACFDGDWHTSCELLGGPAATLI